MVPSSASSRPARIFKRVDLPAPLGLTRPMRSCSSILKLTFAKIRSAPKDFPNCETLRIGMCYSPGLFFCDLRKEMRIEICQPIILSPDLQEKNQLEEYTKPS